MAVTERAVFSRFVPQGRAGQRIVAWLALCLIVGFAVTVYLSMSLAVSADPLLFPLDDSYIHFNYARQLAHGHPMVYSPGDPPTSGGTSLVYPALLALGYLVGFEGWALSYWALGLGAMSFLGSAWLVYEIARNTPLVPTDSESHTIALLLALAYAVSGPLVWAALSGMETALFLFSVLLTLYALQNDNFRMMIGAALMAVGLRPEGSLITTVALLAWLAMHPLPVGRPARFRLAMGLALPAVAMAVQPVINWAVTGSASSSGMQAKSHLANGSIPLSKRVETILEQWVRLWREMLSGRNPEQGEYLSVLVVVMALLAFGWMLAGAWKLRRVRSWREVARQMSVPAVMLAWMIGLSAAVAVLDTAFWQFKRYQLPIMALFFPAAAWGTALFGGRMVSRTGTRWVRWVVPAIIWVSSAWTLIAFAGYYQGNVRVVRDQQVKMAQWVREHVPQETRLGVHDVGLLRYFAERPLYDVVGLTTPGPAASWRQGPGTIYEHMASSQYRPELFAIYPAVQGLGYLVDAGVFGRVLAEFQVDLPRNTVASAADYQAVYEADWSDTRQDEQIAQVSTLDYLAQMGKLALVDQVDVANLNSEAAHHYRWWQDELPSGFVTEVYRHTYYACGLSDAAGCRATDGGRVLTGGEEFTIRTIPGQDVLLVTRVHGRVSAPLLVSWAGGRQSARSTQPQMPGHWTEIVTLLPGESITSEMTRIRIERDKGTAGVYLPYYHWAYQGQFVPQEAADSPIFAAFGESGSIRLNRVTITEESGHIRVDAAWSKVGDLPAADGVLFLHLYPEDALASPPVAQMVQRPHHGVLPPENWLPGLVEDSYTLALPEDLPAGRYRLALGFYDAISGSRYQVQSDEFAVDDRRLFVGEIVIEESRQ